MAPVSFILNDSQAVTINNNHLASQQEWLALSRREGNRVKPSEVLLPPVVQFTKRGRGQSALGTLDESQQAVDYSQGLTSNIRLLGIKSINNTIGVVSGAQPLIDISVLPNTGTEKSSTKYIAETASKIQALMLSSGYQSLTNTFFHPDSTDRKFRFLKNELANTDWVDSYSPMKTLQELRGGLFKHESTTSDLDFELSWKLEDKSSMRATNGADWQALPNIHQCNTALFQEDERA